MEGERELCGTTTTTATETATRSATRRRPCNPFEKLFLGMGIRTGVAMRFCSKASGPPTFEAVLDALTFACRRSPITSTLYDTATGDMVLADKVSVCYCASDPSDALPLQEMSHECSEISYEIPALRINVAPEDMAEDGGRDDQEDGGDSDVCVTVDVVANALDKLMKSTKAARQQPILFGLLCAPQSNPPCSGEPLHKELQSHVVALLVDVNHAFTDGRSIMRLLGVFLDALKNTHAPRGTSVQLQAQEQKGGHPTSNHILGDFSESICSEAVLARAALAKEFAPVSKGISFDMMDDTISAGKESRRREHIEDEEETLHRTHHAALAGEIVTNLLAVCKLHRIKFTCFVAACLQMAFACHFSHKKKLNSVQKDRDAPEQGIDDGPHRATTVTTSIIADAREALAKTGCVAVSELEHVCLAVGSVTYSLEVDTASCFGAVDKHGGSVPTTLPIPSRESIFACARTATVDVHTRLERGEALLQSRALFAGEFGCGAPSALFEVSNVGDVCALMAKGDRTALAVDAVLFDQRFDAFPGVSILCHTDPDRTLRLSVSIGKRLRRHTIVAIVDHALQIMASAAAGPPE